MIEIKSMAGLVLRQIDAADLCGADLRGADLYRADLIGAYRDPSRSLRRY